MTVDTKIYNNFVLDAEVISKATPTVSPVVFTPLEGEGITREQFIAGLKKSSRKIDQITVKAHEEHLAGNSIRLP
jgi:hypothetical protein